MHCLLLVGNLTPADREVLPNIISQECNDWFNYTADAWILCLHKTIPELAGHLENCLSPSHYRIFIDLQFAKVTHSMLPADAWPWLKRHGLIPSTPVVPVPTQLPTKHIHPKRPKKPY